MRRGWHQLFLVLLSVLAGGGLHAQVSVFGKVTDETGLAVTGVRVELRAKASGKAASAVSDVAGNFTLQLASAGEFATCLNYYFTYSECNIAICKLRHANMPVSFNMAFVSTWSIGIINPSIFICKSAPQPILACLYGWVK